MNKDKAGKAHPLTNSKVTPNSNVKEESKPSSYFKSLMNPTATLRKDKNERSRFLGDGVSYKAKLIGILEVSEARGDRMCQEALADLKMAIRAAGEHKQRININIAIDGLRLRDEKTGDCLYHHPVHKISFIAQDMSDSRAFGYIFGSPDTGHRFFGIKTDKAASQVVISMRDLFQVVFELKKKEIEMAKQHIEQHQIKFSSSLTAETSVKTSIEPLKMLPIMEDQNKESPAGAEGGEKTEQIMDLLDLELELNNIQQGINQMERITPSDPFGPPTLTRPQPDPFGDSFNPVTSKAKLPPPPDSTKRSRQSEKHWFDQETEALFEETDLPTSLASLHPPPPHPVFSPPSGTSPSNVSAQPAMEDTVLKRPESPPTREQFDVFTELDPLGTGRSKPYIDKKDFFQELKNPPKKVLKDLVSELPTDNKPTFQANFVNEKPILSNQSIKPDQTVVSKSIAPASSFPDPFQDDPFDKDPFSEVDFSRSVCFTPTSNTDPFEKFADFASFDAKGDSPSKNETKIHQTSPVLRGEESKNIPLRVSLPPEKLGNTEDIFVSPQQSRKFKLQKHNTVSGIIKLPSPKQKCRSKFTSQTSVDSYTDKGSPIMEGVTLRNRNLTQSLSAGSTCSDLIAPEPPPRSAINTIGMKPPPLPPKKLSAVASIKPPPRPPQSDYDYIENYQTTNFADINSPPLPAPARKHKVNQKSSSEPEYYLQPFPLLPPPKKKNPASPKSSTINESSITPDKPLPNASKSLDITLSQLTKTGFSDLAATLNMSPTSLSKMTLQDLTKCLANLSSDNKEDGLTIKTNIESKVERGNILNSEQYLALRESVEDDTPTFPVEFEAHFNNDGRSDSRQEESLFDKYAVFRELLEQEKQQIDTVSEDNSNIAEENEKEDEFQEEEEEEEEDDDEEEEVSEQPVASTESHVIQPAEDRYAALRDICLQEVLQENDEVDTSDKEDSTVEPSRIEEDTDLLSQSRPHSESTESPTLTMKEHQSIMETTIMEEDVSALEVDEDEAPEESVDDTLQESTPPIMGLKYEEDSADHPTLNQHSDKPLFSPTEELEIPIESKSAVPTPVGSSVSWAKFDNGNGAILEKTSSVHSEGRISPWSTESKDNDLSPACREQRKHRKTRRHKPNLWQEDDESEEGWDGRIEPTCWSPSWRENGWSDGDSLYDDTPPYMEREYHSPRRGRRRRVSPWNSRDHSPWEEDDRDLSEDQWESSRWQEEIRQRPKHRGLSWEEERKRHYEDPRKSRKQMAWMNEIDRKSSRESLTWEDEERFQKRNYMDRRRRKWEEENHSRNRVWRERDWIEPGMKMNPRYYRERTHDQSWDDEYSEQGDDEGHWLQRPRSCERGRRQYSAHHSSDGDFTERRYIHSISREDYCSEMDYRRKAHTLQSQKSRRKHNQTSPFEDDFTSHFPFPKDVKSPSGASDMYESDTKQSPAQSESHKKCMFVESSKKKEYAQSGPHLVSSYPREESSSKSSRSYQHSPFEDDFTPPDTRRCSGRSASSDVSDPRGSDDIYIEPKESSKTLRSDTARKPRNGNQNDTLSNCIKGVKSSAAEVESDSNGSKSISHVEPTGIEVSIPQAVSERKVTNADFKSKVSNLRRTDSNTSLRKSESVNIFARNRDPFDDDFFCEDSSPAQQIKERKNKSISNESGKWTEAFKAFSFDEESK